MRRFMITAAFMLMATVAISGESPDTPETRKLAADQRMSPEQFIQLETIKMQSIVCGPQGKATCTFIQNGAAPVYNLNK